MPSLGVFSMYFEYFLLIRMSPERARCLWLENVRERRGPINLDEIKSEGRAGVGESFKPGRLVEHKLWLEG
jgi:hypothetical protein